MKKIFLNIKTRIAEVVGLVGGFFWAKKTNWDYEPLILFIISLASILISILVYFFTKKSQGFETTETKNASSQKIENPSLLEARAIQTEIENASPYLKNQVQKSYLGLSIEWEVLFHTIWKTSGNNYYVTTRYKGGYPWVYFNINIENYPIFKIAKKGQPFFIYGKIIGIGGNTFTIEIDTIISPN